MKILVVEDDRKVAGFIEQGLKEEGYVVDIAADGEEATTLAHVYEYDVILLDVDWFARSRPAKLLGAWAVKALSAFEAALGGVGRSLSSFVGADGPIARSRIWRGAAGNASAAWIAAILAAAMLVGLSTFR